MRLEGWHIVIIVVLAILLFGAPKLPGLARSVGQSLRIFKSEVKQMKDENKSDSTTEPVQGTVVNDPATGTAAGAGTGTGSSAAPKTGPAETPTDRP